MNKKLTILIPVLALTLLVSACAKKPVVNQNLNVNNQNISSTPTPTASPAPEDIEVIESDIDTSNWKTYRNEEFGFEVGYPEGWNVRKYKKGEPIRDPIQSLSSIFIYDDNDKLVFFVLIDELPKEATDKGVTEFFEKNFIDFKNKTNWTTNNVTVARQKTKKYNDGISRIVIPLVKNKWLITINFNLSFESSKYDTKKLFDSILISFIFKT